MRFPDQALPSSNRSRGASHCDFHAAALIVTPSTSRSIRSASDSDLHRDALALRCRRSAEAYQATHLFYSLVLAVAARNTRVVRVVMALITAIIVAESSAVVIQWVF